MAKYTYPDKIAIKPLTKPVNATIRVPPSKSITNRALILAALSCRKGPCRIKNMLMADDTEVMVNCLRQLGFVVSINEGEHGADAEISTTNPLVIIPARDADLFVGNSGTTMRFLTAMVALGDGGRYRLDGSERMRERPIEDLLDALRQLGIDARSELGNGCPPVVIEPNGLQGGWLKIRADVSSQFISALMMVGPLTTQGLEISLEGSLFSRPYVFLTSNVMATCNVTVPEMMFNTIRVPGKHRYRWPEHFTVAPDATSAGYFLSAAVIVRGQVNISDLALIRLQADMAFLLVALDSMGAMCLDDMSTTGNTFRGIDLDMNWYSDTAMTLAAVACFADSPTTIRNVAHIRHKECDRIAAMTTELRKLGVEVEEYPDGWKITPRLMHGAELETYNDHRIAMSLALIGLKVPGVVIKNPGCVAKTYPGFWDDFEKLYA